LSDEELEQRYRAAGDPVARSQWQIVWLLALGEPSERVAAVTGYSLTWVRTVARRYHADGAAGIGDRRHATRGGPRLLTPEQEAALEWALEGAAPGGGRWTAAKVAAWMSQQLGRPVGEATGWRVLRRRDWRRYRPRPQHAKAATAAQAAFRQTTSASK
jgi:transposase